MPIRRALPSMRQALERADTRRFHSIPRHLMDAADRRANASARLHAIEHMVYGRLSPGMRASLPHRRAALQGEIAANLF